LIGNQETGRCIRPDGDGSNIPRRVETAREDGRHPQPDKTCDTRAEGEELVSVSSLDAWAPVHSQDTEAKDGNDFYPLLGIHVQFPEQRQWKYQDKDVSQRAGRARQVGKDLGVVACAIKHLVPLLRDRSAPKYGGEEDADVQATD
jgi:hypothetical protein